jgi:hypothetical protein
MKHAVLVMILCSILLPACEAADKHRIVVMTDIGGDPDDRQSMVRFLLYTCDFDVEGFCTGFGHGHDRQTRPDLIHDTSSTMPSTHTAKSSRTCESIEPTIPPTTTSRAS